MVVPNTSGRLVDSDMHKLIDTCSFLPTVVLTAAATPRATVPAALLYPPPLSLRKRLIGREGDTTAADDDDDAIDRTARVERTMAAPESFVIIFERFVMLCVNRNEWLYVCVPSDA